MKSAFGDYIVESVNEPVLEKAREEVANLLENDNSGHNMEHVNRVFNLSLIFSEKEKANKMIVLLTALLHDVDDYKLFGVKNAKNLTNAKKIMIKCDIEQNIQNDVCLAISEIGYHKRLDGIIPTTNEAKIVSDADMCDGIGANGILRCYAYSNKAGMPFFDRNVFPAENVNSKNYVEKPANNSICHIFEKCLKLKNLMLTKSGKNEAKKRHDFTVKFLYQLFSEEDAHEWIKYLDNYLKN